MFIDKTKIILVLFFFISLNFLDSHPKFSVNYTNAEKVYFERNKWEFMDKVFMTYVKNETSSYDSLNTNTAVFCGSIPFIFMTLVALTEKDFNLFLSGAFISAIVALVVGIIMHAINSNDALNERLSNIFVWFIENYNPDLNSNMPVNFKNFVPEELYEVFDAMHAGYDKLGEKYLNNRGLYPLYNLRNKIKHDVMKKKYRQSDVVYHCSPCCVK